MADERIALDSLPGWAQDMIVRTALGLLECENAYAIPTANSLWYTIRADGFSYTLYKHAEYVY